jgi:primase-polymerase (primpol)-like protein
MPRSRPPKPATYNGDLANLPIALASRTEAKRWVVWRWVWQRGRWDKPPFQASNPKQHAKSNDPATWGAYGDAVAAVAAGRADGIGYMLADADLVAVDLDHCRNSVTCEIEAWAQNEIAGADGAYVEVTVSGTGLRILGTGDGGELQRKFKIQAQQTVRPLKSIAGQIVTSR